MRTFGANCEAVAEPIIRHVSQLGGRTLIDLDRESRIDVNRFFIRNENRERLG